MFKLRPTLEFDPARAQSSPVFQSKLLCNYAIKSIIFTNQNASNLDENLSLVFTLSPEFHLAFFKSLDTSKVRKYRHQW